MHGGSPGRCVYTRRTPEEAGPAPTMGQDESRAGRGNPRGLVSSRELAERARGGDREALDRLVERYLPGLRRWAAGRLPRWAREQVDTDDMVQDVLMATLRNVERFSPRRDGALGAYLRRALDNRVKDEIRRVRRLPPRDELADEHADRAPGPLEEAVGAEALRRYERALSSLPEDDRELILARIEMGMGYDAVAAATGKPSAEAARMAVGRALVRLAREMDHE